MNRLLWVLALTLSMASLGQAEQTVLFDGKNLDAWEFRPAGWVIEDDGSMSCRMETVTAKDGKKARVARPDGREV